MKPQNTDKATAKITILQELYAIANGFDTPSDKAKEAAAAIVAIEEHAALVAVEESATSVSDAVAEGCSSEGEFIIGLNAKLIEARANLAAVREGGAK